MSSSLLVRREFILSKLSIMEETIQLQTVTSVLVNWTSLVRSQLSEGGTSNLEVTCNQQFATTSFLDWEDFQLNGTEPILS